MHYDLLAVDVDMGAQSDWMQGLLRLLASRAGRDVVHGLPLVTVDFASAMQAAFRLLQKGHNVGKVVVRVTPQQASLLREGSTDLITGGTGGLGLLTAGWLAGVHRTAHLSLVSRSGCVAAQRDGCVPRLPRGCVASAQVDSKVRIRGRRSSPQRVQQPVHAVKAGRFGG